MNNPLQTTSCYEPPTFSPSTYQQLPVSRPVAPSPKTPYPSIHPLPISHPALSTTLTYQLPPLIHPKPPFPPPFSTTNPRSPSPSVPPFQDPPLSNQPNIAHALYFSPTEKKWWVSRGDEARRGEAGRGG